MDENADENAQDPATQVSADTPIAPESAPALSVDYSGGDVPDSEDGKAADPMPGLFPDEDQPDLIPPGVSVPAVPEGVPVIYPVYTSLGR